MPASTATASDRTPAAPDLEPTSPGWWNARYQSGDAPWDTGIVPPELISLITTAQVRRGWALDLGCGSGVSSLYLARHGFRVIGVDLAHTPLKRATEAARTEARPAYFCVGDATDLGFLSVRATFALDIGCLHAVSAARREAYVTSLAARLLPGALYLLYAFEFQSDEPDTAMGIGPGEIALFARHFRLCWVQHGTDRGRPSAWYLLQRLSALVA